MKMSSYSHVKEWRNKSKKILKGGFGSRCGICKYDACEEALDFHHLNILEKSFGLGSSSVMNIERLTNEAKKCVLLCCRCHREVHAGLTLIPKDIVRFNDSYLEEIMRLSKKKDDCPLCGKEKESRRSFCSLKCASSNRQKIDWSKIDLLMLIKQEGNVEAVSRKLNISGNAIRKHLKKYPGVSPHPDKVSKE